jgi:hypothetical protein
LLEVAYTHPKAAGFYDGISGLDKLIQHWAKLESIRTGHRPSTRQYEDFTPLPEYRREIFTSRGLEPIVNKR